MTEREQFEVEFAKLGYQWSDANKDKAFLGWQMAHAQAVPSDVLHTFLDAAAGEGLVLGGVDAADLYIKLFPERYAAAIAAQGAKT